MKVNPSKSFFWSFITAVAALIIFSIFFSSCVTEKQRRKICNSCAVETHNTETITIIHDTVPKLIPGKDGPIVYLENPCKLLCDSLGNLKKGVDINVSRNGMTTHVKTQGNGINISTASKDTTLKIPVTNSVTVKDTKEAEVKYIPCANERTAFDGWCRWFFYIFAPLIAIYMVLKFYFRLPI